MRGISKSTDWPFPESNQGPRTLRLASAVRGGVHHCLHVSLASQAALFKVPSLTSPFHPRLSLPEGQQTGHSALPEVPGLSLPHSTLALFLEAC